MRMNRTPLDVDPIPVSIVKTTEELSDLASEFGGTSNFSVPLIGQNNGLPPVQILQRRPTRYKAVILVGTLGTSFATLNQMVLVTSGTPFYNNNPIGVYVTVTGGTVTAIAVNGTTTGAIAGTFFVPAGGTMTITETVAPALVTTAASPLPALTSASGIMLAYRAELLSNANNPQGFLINTAPYTFQWENQQPCYAAAIGSGPVTISVIDQAGSARESQAEETAQSGDMDLDSELEGGRDFGAARAGNLY